MKNNITREDLNCLIEYLQQPEPRLTNGPKVREFEQKWGQWLGTNDCVFVNSGASANLITLTALRETCGVGEIIVPPLTWASDIASIIQTGFQPRFVDINPKTLAINSNLLDKNINPNTKAIFLTHILGLNGIDNKLIDILHNNPHIKLIEDVCESHGATFNGKKLGTYGYVSNFSFYYAHHMSSIEGGIICTQDDNFYNICRMIRSHGMVREADDESIKNAYAVKYPSLHPDFIFAYPSYNMRSSELNAVLAINQLKRLDINIKKRNKNLNIFLSNLNEDMYVTDLNTEGCSSYALILIIKHPDKYLYEKVIKTLTANNIEFRRGLSGGGNQMRQPYVINNIGNQNLDFYPVVEHIHQYGFYMGNYPDLTEEEIIELCHLLNKLDIS